MQEYYQDLEYDKVCGFIAAHCHSELGKELALALKPLSNRQHICENLAINYEIQDAILHGLDFNFEEIVEIGLLFEKEQSPVFSYEEFLNIYHNISCANILHKSGQEIRQSYPLLHKKLSRLFALPEIEARFNRIFDFEGQVLDTASAELQRIRRQISALVAKISRTMQNLVQDPAMSSYLQDKFVTQRNERYVIPVKEGSVPNVRGIVQSRSATKSTVFVEPEAVVPLSNELQLLRQEEKNEIYRIFVSYTADVRAFAPQIIANTKLLAELDFRFGIGRFGKKLESRVPQICDEPKLSLIGARHPLLILRMGSVHQVIPYDVALGQDYRLLILSGPNTGGKTVLLKAVGLLCLMAISGIPIPVKQETEIGIFGSVFADIGDDQSIENALSTFSSHLDKIGRMLKIADERSLVLIDEIGAATDPGQGSALAQVILERFNDLKVKGIVTTHYTALKVYAEQADGCINASMQFDLKSLQPTYKFVPGFPGDSFAIEVAASLGLDPILVERAKSLCGSQSIEFTELLKNMQTEKKKLGRELYEYQLKNHNLQSRIDDLDKKQAEFDKELKQRRQQHLKELQKELIALQKAYTAELNDIRSLDKEKRKHHSEEKLQQLQHKQDELSKTLRSFNSEDRDPLGTPKPGDRVWMQDFETEATLVSINGKDALVDMNGISFKTKLENLFSAAAKPNEPEIPLVKTSVAAPKVRLEIKLLGLTFDEARPIIDEAIDEAIVAGLHSLRIVHGKGTGALRNKIHSYLQRKKQVNSINTPPPEAGGSGVTIANF